MKFSDSQETVQRSIVECGGLLTTVRVLNLERLPCIRDQRVFPVMGETEGFVVGVLRAGWPSFALVWPLGGALVLVQLSHHKGVYQTGKRLKLLRRKSLERLRKRRVIV